MVKVARYCSVAECGSKSPAFGPNKRTLFRVPIDSERREKWLEVLSPNLRPGRQCRKELYVCDLHFKPEDVLKSLILAYPDGSVEEIPRENVRLKPSSLPSIFDHASHQYEVFAEHEMSQSESDRELNLNILHPKMSADQDQNAVQGELSAEQNHSTLQGELVVCVKQESQDSVYNLDTLTVDVNNSGLAQNQSHWIFSRIPSALLFYCLVDDFPNPTRSILVKEDMSAEIRAKGRIAQLNDLNLHVGCFQDLLSIVATIEGLHLCRGVDGVPCPCGFSERKNSRCRACSAEQRRKRNRELKRTKRSIAKKITMQKFLKNLKRKYDRLQKKYVIATEVMDILKVRCSEASESVTTDSIKSFPAQKQEAVRA